MATADVYFDVRHIVYAAGCFGACHAIASLMALSGGIDIDVVGVE